MGVENQDYGTPASGPLSWRDVYRAVEESEKRILKALGDVALPLRTDSEDHERRLRAIEDAPKNVARLEGMVLQYHKATDERLDRIEKAALVSEAKRVERGHIVLSVRTMVLAVISIVTSIIVASAGAVAMINNFAK
jgi:hypothetical protein